MLLEKKRKMQRSLTKLNERVKHGHTTSNRDRPVAWAVVVQTYLYSLLPVTIRACQPVTPLLINEGSVHLHPTLYVQH